MNNPNEMTTLIDQILDIELDWFLNVNKEITSECQHHPQAFRVMRRSSFRTWSPETLTHYLAHVQEMSRQGHNLVREKYAKMQSSLDCDNPSPAIGVIMKVQESWQQATRQEFPAIFHNQPSSGFAWYLRCEIDTYSAATLESYLEDVTAAAAAGRNLITETYENLARELGYESLGDWCAARQTEPPATD